MTYVSNLIIPVINRPDLLKRTIESIDTKLRTLLIIDNSPKADIGPQVMDIASGNPYIEHVFCIYPWVNMGVAASWNFGIKQLREDGYWIIANADTEFGKGDLAALAAIGERQEPVWVGVNGDWRVFVINHWTIDRVGLFDENFHPIYCEDADFERRCTLSGVKWTFIDGLSTHEGSVSWKSDERGHRNNGRTYAKNVSYYITKWGAPPRSGRREQFETPFNEPVPLDYWRTDIRRLDGLDWD